VGDHETPTSLEAVQLLPPEITDDSAISDGTTSSGGGGGCAITGQSRPQSSLTPLLPVLVLVWRRRGLRRRFLDEVVQQRDPLAR